MPETTRDWTRFEHIQIDDAARRIEGVARRTPLEPVDCGDPRIELRAKLENRQETGSFKVRGATNNVALLTDEERARGVVACSSGNHGRALAYAAQRAGIAATIVMPEDAYPNKIAACRELGAEIVLTPDRVEADVEAEAIAARGVVFVHPYDRDGTIEGAGTVGKEIAEQWPEVDLVIVPVGGGGLIAGSSLALRRALGDGITILGAEPAGAPTMHLGLEAGEPVPVVEITTGVQGLCPTTSGARNIAICGETVDGVVLLSDEEIHAAQRALVLGGEVVEPAGAAAVAVVHAGHVPAELLEGRDADRPLRVVAIVSGGNPDPAQLERLRSGG